MNLLAEREAEIVVTVLVEINYSDQLWQCGKGFLTINRKTDYPSAI